MATLHGSWLVQSQRGFLFIWGETWRPMSVETQSSTFLLADSVPSHPMAMTREELISFLHSSNIHIGKFAQGPQREITCKEEERWLKEKIGLPTRIPKTGRPIAPELSTKIFGEDASKAPISLYLWEVEGLRLEPLEAMKFLQTLPLSSFQATDDYIGSDLRFWSHIARWSLELLARCKFLPALHQQLDGVLEARWQPLLDSAADRARLQKFSSLMPAACCTYELDFVLKEKENAVPLTLPDREGDMIDANLKLVEPQKLLLGFLSSTVDALVRIWAGTPPLPGTAPLVRDWLQALGTASDKLEATDSAAGGLEVALRTWTLPVQDHLVANTSQGLGKSQFRTCFSLKPPESGESNWMLEYFLQADRDPEFLVNAKTIWNCTTDRLVDREQTIEDPQETFLKGLGLACRLYPPIEPSLHERHPQSCNLTPVQAYEFIKASAWRLQDSGLGVVLPPSLTPGKAGSNRMGLKIRSAQTQGKQLGLQNLLKFDWELAIGDRSLSKKEFDRLVALKTPFVEVNGEWVMLQPQEIKAAQTLLATPREQLDLSLEDALRLSTGDSQTIEKLPVVSFQADGPLQELLATLSNNQKIEAIAPPANFRGELRPYQARGVAWLAFLERWGLGACLADDMGLGKCITPDSLVFVNGTLQTAEDIWDARAGKTQFDGEGFWATPTEQLLVNAIDEQTSQIVLAPIRRLYRQHVKEKLRTLRLKDGSSITITYRHKLLTHNGWTNNLQVGDYVCVPAKTVWNGQPADPDLVAFLAWQIAEGYEQGGGVLTISQKDTKRLEELLQIFQRIGQRYNLKLDPTICTFSGKVPVLRANARAYQQFLEAKGYIWGKRSREKSIPPCIMQADLDSVRIFLRHYFDAESAVVSSMKSIEISTASPLLIQQLSSLLRRFGIWLRLAPKQKRPTNGSGVLSTYYIGTIGGDGARKFLQEIGFTDLRKQRELEEICQQASNTNVEGIPCTDIYEPVRLGDRDRTDLQTVNGMPQFSRISLERVLAGFEGIITDEAEQEYRQQKLSQQTAQTLKHYAQLDIEQLSVTRQRLQHLLDREVFYSQIQAIEDVEYEGWVYDFEVSEHHNFVANNILCHNTIQYIAFLLHLKEQKRLEKPTLLVCPTSVLGNWEREVKKFGPTLQVLVHHGDKRAKDKAFAKAVRGKDLVITSYPLAYRDAKTLEGIAWRGIVLDEAQNIKNVSSKQSQAVRQMEAEFRIALTGTPVENRLSELWSILDFLNRGYLGTQPFFQRRFAIPIEKYGDRESLQSLRSLVQPFILRRLKTDREIIQDLPEKQEMNVFCGLSAEQAALYQKLVDESLVEIEDVEGIQRHGKILTLLLKLKQICNHPAHYLKEKTLGQPHRSGKLQRLVEMLEEVVSEGESRSASLRDRALIFTQFAEWGKLLQPYLEQQLGCQTLFLYGSTSKKQREEMIDRFQHDPQGPPIMILSLKAGGTGLNLTRATHVFHFDRWWNPAVENQATDRVFRIGQTRNVQVHKFVCTGTLEEKINDLIESKKQLAEQTVNAGEQWLTQMDTDQLRTLLILDRNAVIDEE